jgi:hydroxyethylthiazole kinase-like uncharacterized protein yjeF
MRVSRVSEMRELDRKAIEEFGIAAELLMENAGQAVYFALLDEFGIAGKRFVIFCGLGNNGGDGLVVARKIHSSGGMVRVFVLGDPGRFKGAAKINFDIVSRLPIDVRQIESPEAARTEVARCDCIVDAILGTGLTREVTGLYREVIELVNGSGKTVFSVDIPSGVHGDTGKVMGTAVRADVTVTFGLPKIGNVLFPGYDLGGKLYVSHISFPPSIYDADSLKIAISSLAEIPPRDEDGHKGDFGQALFVAGAAGYFGAPYFSALSFLKAGGGYSRLAAPHSIVPFIGSKGSEIVFHPQAETDAGSIALQNKPALLDLSERMDMVIVGPGLSLNPETQRLARELTAEIDKPLLIDGDGITAVCQDLGVVKGRRAETILTPHLGEMSRLTKTSVREIDDNKVDVLQRTAAELNATIVLKGAHSLIGYPDGLVFINMSGNPGMATAGSGDVLTGAIAAMFGLGLPLQTAVRQGVFVHGLAGDLAAEDRGEDGITAQDILDYLPPAMKAIRRGLSEVLRERYAGAQVV